MSELAKPLAAARSRALSLAVSLAAALAAAVLLLAAFGSSFGEALALFFLGPFKNAYYFGNLLNAAVPLTLCGLGVAVAFAGRRFNLGGEGQLYLGAVAAAAACLALPEPASGLGAAAGKVAAAAVGSLAGGLLGAFSGWLRRRLEVDELISSFLVSAAAICLADFLVTGPLQDPASNFQTTAAIPGVLRLARVYLPSSLNSGCLVALLAVLLAWLGMDRTRLGFELKLCGRNREFARYVGIDAGAYDVATMALSGALHGLAGAIMILGTYYKAMKGFSAGVGWSGIAVALVAGPSPLAALPAALFFAYLQAGAKAVMIGSDVSSEIVAVVQSVVFFLVTARALDAPSRARRPAARGGVRRPGGARRPGGEALR